MEDLVFTHVDRFFRTFTAIGVWRRIFRWKEVRDLGVAASQEIQTLLADFQRTSEFLQKTATTLSLAERDLQHEREDRQRLQTDSVVLSSRMTQLTDDLAGARQRIAILEQQDSQRQARYDANIAALHAIREGITDDRAEELEDRRSEKAEHDEQMRRTWVLHQDNVRERLRLICQKHTIEYVEDVPFFGSPDNTLSICNEYIIFDAKSPAATDRLANFRTYLKVQAEAANKYVRRPNVRKEVYFVIPSNTLDVFDTFCHDLAEYKVFIVTIDMLEPLILGMKRLEMYEFAEQLSPEDREDICRVIGRFEHLTKRRLQVDQFFGARSLELLGRAEAELPPEIQERVNAFGRSDKINPPIEQRSKEINIGELFERHEKLGKEAERFGTPAVRSGQDEIPE